jgi:drug/metabolite transporter (DMT)-like permease
MRDRSTTAAFLVVVVLAGGNAVAVRFSNHELAPLWGATLRFIIAAALLLLAVWISRLALPHGRALVGSILYGLTGFAAAFAFLYSALVDVGAGLGQIILALVPLFTLLLAVIHGLERFQWQSLLGSAVAVGGIAIIFGDQVEAAVPLASLLAVLAGAACIAESNVIIKRYPRAHPLATNAVAMGVAALALLVATLVAGQRIVVPTRAETWLAVGYISVVGSIAVFTLFLYVIARWSASASSYVMLLIPLVTVALGAALDHEAVTTAYFIGGPLVLLGVYIGAFAPPLARVRQVLARVGQALPRPAPARTPALEATGPMAAVSQEPSATEEGVGNPGCC